jgi:hypothetical protein
MTKTLLKFDAFDEPISVVFESSKNAEFFLTRLKNFARPADSVGLHQPFDQQLEDFLSKAKQAKELFNFDWDINVLSRENFNHWHRDIETFDLSQHPPYTQEKGDFFIALHGALHLVEDRAIQKEQESNCKTKNFSVLSFLKKLFDTSVPANPAFRRTSCSIKWAEKNVPWPEIPKFKSRLEIKKGDIIVDFPHVGKTPWTSMQNNDVENLEQSCKLPDVCPPGFVIALTDSCDATGRNRLKLIQQQEQQLIDWYQQNIHTLSKLFSQEKMLMYNGEYCIGHVENLDQLQLLQTADVKSVSII